MIEIADDEKAAEPSDEEQLLTEPDHPDDDDEDQEEASTVAGGAVRGVITPLGTGPTYPRRGSRSRKRARKDQVRVVGDAFGGARPFHKK